MDSVRIYFLSLCIFLLLQDQYPGESKSDATFTLERVWSPSSLLRWVLGRQLLATLV